MKIFISWSGGASEQLGRSLGEWFSFVFQHVNPFFSQDIDKGERWSDTIAAALNESVLGVVCLTRQNITNPSILFEAGALAHGLPQSKIATVLLDIGPAEIPGWPLSQFQHTLLKDEQLCKQQIHRLAVSVNNSSGERRLDDRRLEKTVDLFWDDLAKGITKARSLAAQHRDAETRRPTDEKIDEILGLVRQLAVRPRPPSPPKESDVPHPRAMPELHARSAPAPVRSDTTPGIMPGMNPMMLQMMEMMNQMAGGMQLSSADAARRGLTLPQHEEDEDLDLAMENIEGDENLDLAMEYREVPERDYP